VLWIRSLIQQQIAILAVTTGVYFIAATKLADHILLATHWAFIRELNGLFLAVHLLKIEIIYAGSIYSTGTLLGTFDALLGIVAQHKGIILHNCVQAIY
jgi:transcriptional regulator GlxA family with amidase domain